MPQKIQDIIAGLEKGFFGFWIRNYRMAYLFITVILIVGLSSLASIPKESAPDIKFGILSVGTLYTGVSPADVDNLVTTKIEKEIKDLEGIDKIESTSRLGFSSIILTLETDVDTSDVMIDVKDAIDKVDLPSDAEDPVVTEISSDNEMVFAAYLYADPDEVPKDALYDHAERVVKKLEAQPNITSVEYAGGDDYEIYIRLDRDQIQNMGLSLNTVASAIRANNQNIPLGNFQVGDRQYDFRVDGEITDFGELFSIPLQTASGTSVRLGEVATIERKWTNEDRQNLGWYGFQGKHYVQLYVNKVLGSNIFQTADQAQAGIQEVLDLPEVQGVDVYYGLDMSDVIRDDYRELARNAAITLLLVFGTLLFFVGLKEGFIATVSIPLAFLITFFVLDKLGLSLNFMTNFSMVLTLGIAIDVTIVIIEAASEYRSVGYTPRNAVLLAVRDFKKPLIAGTTTTLVVFIPMMMLPGILGKFLAYIPITVFTTLIAALFLALTVNTTLFYKLSKNKDTYIKRSDDEKHLPEDDALLQEDRKGKRLRDKDFGPRERFLKKIESTYINTLKPFISSRKGRVLAIFTPIIVLILTFMFLAPRIGFILFPSGDNPFIFVTVESSAGETRESFTEKMGDIEPILSDIPEVKFYTIAFQDGAAQVTIELEKKSVRDERGQRTSQVVEKELFESLAFLKSDGLRVETKVETNGPPVGKAVGLKLIASETPLLPTLIDVSKDFEDALRKVEGTKNVSNSSDESPGQVIFKVRNGYANDLGITPSQIYGELASLSNGVKAGSIKKDGDDVDIVVIYDDFVEEVRPDLLLRNSIATPRGDVILSTIVDYEITNAVQNIKREDTNLLISVEADLLDGFQPGPVQGEFQKFASQYVFPEGISFTAAGENAENQELLVATGVSFVLAILMIFVILVLLFNSFAQPLIILYSVVLALLGVNIGLFIMNILHSVGLFYAKIPYSLPFGIGFIALTGIVVNDAIILIDKINRNIKIGMEAIPTVIEAGRSRLQPIILTTLTTVFGLLPLAYQDEFWAGLSFTVVFGLFAGSAMTLFVIPALYFELFLVKDSFIRYVFFPPLLLVKLGKKIWLKIRRTA